MTTWTNSKGNKIEAEVIGWRKGWVIRVDGIEVDRGEVSTIGNHPVVAAMAGKYGIPHAQYQAMCAEMMASKPADVIANEEAMRKLYKDEDEMAKVMRD